MAIEPFGFEVENWRAGMIAAAVCNEIVRTRPVAPGRPRPKLLAPADFYPPIPGARRRQLTPEQQAFIERKRRDRSRDSNS
jgi:hypothetical protein